MSWLAAKTAFHASRSAALYPRIKICCHMQGMDGLDACVGNIEYHGSGSDTLNHEVTPPNDLGSNGQN